MSEQWGNIIIKKKTNRRQLNGITTNTDLLCGRYNNTIRHDFLFRISENFHLRDDTAQTNIHYLYLSIPFFDTSVLRFFSFIFFFVLSNFFHLKIVEYIISVFDLFP